MMDKNIKNSLAMLNKASIDPTDDQGWDYDNAVHKCRNLSKLVRENGEELVKELLLAHEKIVKRKVPGKTWKRFCEEIGISEQTVMNWFKRWGLAYSRTAGPEPKNFNSKESGVKLLCNKLVKCSKQLQFLAKNKMDLTPDDEIWLDKIQDHASYMLLGYYMIGVNILKIYNNLIDQGPDNAEDIHIK